MQWKRKMSLQFYASYNKEEKKIKFKVDWTQKKVVKKFYFLSNKKKLFSVLGRENLCKGVLFFYLNFYICKTLI